MSKTPGWVSFNNLLNDSVMAKLSPDGDCVFATDGMRLTAWNVADGRALADTVLFQPPKCDLYSVSVTSHQGKLLVALSNLVSHAIEDVSTLYSMVVDLVSKTTVCSGICRVDESTSRTFFLERSATPASNHEPRLISLSRESIYDMDIVGESYGMALGRILPNTHSPWQLATLAIGTLSSVFKRYT